ncbi:MAG: single-stranded DNA-binding protein [Phototrophicales bacterium]|nr:MAG: single-stranded DNA-binding protein [Phototrophicales bacterium]
MYQQIMIIGNVGRDPETRQTAGGATVCSFSVAVNKTWTDRQSGEKRQQTTWFRISAWRQLGEICSQYVRKGMLIMVAGEIDAQAYMGNDGTPRATLEITARDVKFLSSRGETYAMGDDYENEGGYGGYQQGGSEDDIPF